MKTSKTITLLACSLISTALYAEGCTTLANSNWSAELLLTTGKTITLPIHIANVTAAGDGLYILTGSINNKPLSHGYGCVEQLPGQIRSVLLNTDNTQLASHTLMPDRSRPSELKQVTGIAQGIHIDITTNAAINVIHRQ